MLFLLDFTVKMIAFAMLYLSATFWIELIFKILPFDSIFTFFDDYFLTDLKILPIFFRRLTLILQFWKIIKILH